MDDGPVFKALADPVRRTLLDSLHADGGKTLSELAAGHAMSRQAVTKHLDILERANLVVSEKRGRERLHHLNAVPIQEIADRWIGKFRQGPVRALAALKQTLEGEPLMANDRFVYVTYIRSTPQKVWDALTKPELTRLFWFGTHQESAWTAGADWKMKLADGRIADAGKVLEVEPPKRLKLEWRHQLDAALQAEGASRCLIEIEPDGDGVRLAVTHEIDVDNSKLIVAVSGGWPKILSSLKSYLETGQALAGADRPPEPTKEG